MASEALLLREAEQPAVRALPSNVEAEAAFLGAVLIDNRVIEELRTPLVPGHFFEPIHARIYERILHLLDRKAVVTPVTLRPYFEADEGLKALGGLAYLARLTANEQGLLAPRELAEQIYDLALLRELVSVGRNLVEGAMDTSESVEPLEQIEHAEAALYKVAEGASTGSEAQSFSTATRTAITAIEKAFNSGGHISGKTTGLNSVNAKIGGLHDSDLIILAGRPGMGKTSLATNIAFNIAEMYVPAQQADGSFKAANGGVVGFFSLEMSSEQLATRIISEQTEISSSKIRRGEISEMDFEKLVACSQTMQKIPLFIDQTGGISIAQLSARARRLKRQRGLDLIVIDYIQLMQGSSAKSSQNRVQEITEITTGLKALAKELGVPIIALSQLSRQVESRDDKRPQLSDLRESGSIEQDADVVLFVFREEYYVERRQPRENTEEHIKWQQEMDMVTGKAEVIIGKQRHGPTGTVRLQFTPEFTRFGNLAAEERLPERLD